MHTVKKLFPFQECTKDFLRRKNLKMYVIAGRNGTALECKKRFVLKDRLKSCTAIKPYKCITCMEILSRFKHHTSITIGEKTYSCEVCGKAFNQNRHLYKERLEHFAV